MVEKARDKHNIRRDNDAMSEALARVRARGQRVTSGKKTYMMDKELPLI